MKRDMKEPPSLMEPPSMVQTPVYEVVDGKLHIYFKPDKPTVKIGGQVFCVDDMPTVIIGGRREKVTDIF